MLKQLAPILTVGIALESLWIGSYSIGDFRAATEPFLVFVLAAFLLSFFAFLRCPIRNRLDSAVVLTFALLFRLTALPAEPHQSEDVYRYLWDARVAAHGIDPYRYSPDAPELTYLRDERIYPRLNSKPYVTVYPPLSQLLFRSGLVLFGERVIGMKVLFALFEFLAVLLTFRLLGLLGLSPNGIYLTAWNPFFVLEFAHSGHSESAMMFFILLAIYLLARGQRAAAWISYACAVLFKLHPALWFPAFLKRTGWKPALAGLAAGLAILVSYFTLSTLPSYLSSLRLYFRLFEFNASIHYLLCAVGRDFYGEAWDQLTGPYLAAALMAATLLISWKHPIRNERDLLHAGFWIMTADLCLATTVHPWYLAWAALALPFFPYAFMTCWTALSVLSYVAYAYRPVYEPAWVLLVEYVPVYALMFWEIARRRPLLKA